MDFTEASSDTMGVGWITDRADGRMDVVSNMGFPSMTPVQASSIPRGLKNQDLVVEVRRLTNCADKRRSLALARR